MDMIAIGKNLRELRREKGMTQEQLAEHFNVARRTVSRWETGSNMPDLDILIEMSDFYDVDLRELLDGEKSGNGEEDSNEGTFVGKFYHDKKNGKGKMIYKLSGDIYEGDYKNGLFDGKGHYIWKNTGQEYTGDYKNGVMHGKGY